MAKVSATAIRGIPTLVGYRDCRDMSWPWPPDTGILIFKAHNHVRLAGSNEVGSCQKARGPTSATGCSWPGSVYTGARWNMTVSVNLSSGGPPGSFGFLGLPRLARMEPRLGRPLEACALAQYIWEGYVRPL
jgi:hypothetical protein